MLENLDKDATFTMRIVELRTTNQGLVSKSLTGRITLIYRSREDFHPGLQVTQPARLQVMKSGALRGAIRQFFVSNIVYYTWAIPRETSTKEALTAYITRHL